MVFSKVRRELKIVHICLWPTLQIFSKQTINRFLLQPSSIMSPSRSFKSDHFPGTIYIQGFVCISKEPPMWNGLAWWPANLHYVLYAFGCLFKDDHVDVYFIHIYAYVCIHNVHSHFVSIHTSPYYILCSIFKFQMEERKSSTTSPDEEQQQNPFKKVRLILLW